MDEDEKYWMLEAMRRRGGRFVKTLALAWRLADNTNLKRLEDAFPEYKDHYLREGLKLRDKKENRWRE